MLKYSKYEPKACPRCNSEHICTGTSNCACFAVEIDDQTLDHIAFHFDDCLCPDCLQVMKNK
jgi:hypothetical protein